jgi:class 3 adenylate cyclase/anti-anti-sigma regulatory factor
MVDVARVGRIAHVRVLGSLSTPLAPALEGLGPESIVLLDLGGLNRISSLGIRYWMEAVRRLPAGAEAVYVVNAPPPVVDQYLMVSGFAGVSQLLSILAPYACDHCGEEVVRSIDLRASEEFIARGAPPRFLCVSCRGPLRFIDSERDFAELINLAPGAEPHPAVVHYLSSSHTTQLRPGIPPVKLVSGDITFFSLRGSIGAQLNLRRLSEGLEGRVVYDFACVTDIDPAGAARLSELLERVVTQAAVFLWRVPPQLAAHLERLPLERVHVETLWLPATCRRCDRLAPVRVPAPDYARWLEGGQAPERPCSTCSSSVVPARHPELSSALSRALSPGLCEEEIEPLEISALRQQLMRYSAGDDTSVWIKLAEIRRFALRMREAEGASTDERLDRIMVLIDEAGEALRERDRTQRLVFATSEIGKICMASVDASRLLQLSLEVIARVLDADRGIAFVMEAPEKQTPAAHFSRTRQAEAAPSPLAAAVVADVAGENRSLWLRNALSSERYLGVAQDLFPGRSVLAVPACSSAGQALAILYLEGTTVNPMFDQRGLAFLESVASYIAAGLERVELERTTFAEQQRRQRLSRYFSEAVVQEILEGGQSPHLGGVGRTVTVLFTDIRNSSRMLEQLAPEDAVRVLNEYFTVLIEEILSEQGTIDKFTGDGLMALWNAPTEQPDHALRAARAALKIQTRLPLLFEDWRRRGGAFTQYGLSLATGIGINTGDAVVGSIGSHKRMEYTAIGDAVHLCARIQGLSQGREVLLSAATLERLPSASGVKAMEAVQLKGRQEPVVLYRLLSVPGLPPLA